MPRAISIIYSFRDRNLDRIKISLDSLSKQSYLDFEVVFVDYGSEPHVLSNLVELLNQFQFVRLVKVPANGKLWSRSKALNIGIKEARFELLFIVDIDLYFSTDAIANALEEFQSGCFFGGNWYFLNKSESKLLLSRSDRFFSVEAKISDDNGMLLVEKKNLQKIHGYDEFFHLYGGEDTDIKNRLIFSGVEHKKLSKTNSYHIWHPHAIPLRPKRLSKQPYAYNIKRINEKHVFFNEKNKLSQPIGQNEWGICNHIDPNKSPDQVFFLENVHSQISHFFNFILPTVCSGLIDLTIQEAAEYKSLKTKLKTFVKGNSEPFLSLQEINELITEKLVFRYKDHAYSYFIENSRGVINLKLQV